MQKSKNGNQLKMVYFSFNKSMVKQMILNKNGIYAGLILSSLFFILISFFMLKGMNSVYSNWKISHLKAANTQLEEQILLLKHKITELDRTIQNFEQTDDDLRVFVDLPEFNKDIRKLGIGGQSSETFAQYNYINDQLISEVNYLEKILVNLTLRVEVLTDSRDEIVLKYNQNVTILKQTPSIRPVVNGRITDKFGYRTDPFTGSRQHHNGVDISAPRGTDILASADGVVIEAVQKYTPNQLRGKYIIIDHGYGFQTKYAHLSKVLVKPGQIVRRYNIIGKVGDTGRATGPHLHYEVSKNNVQEDPTNFFLDL